MHTLDLTKKCLTFHSRSHQLRVNLDFVFVFRDSEEMFVVTSCYDTYVMLCYVLRYAMLCYDMLCYVMLCYAMLFYVMLRYVILIFLSILISSANVHRYAHTCFSLFNTTDPYCFRHFICQKCGP